MLTQQQIDEHNARVQADWEATREQREAERVADIEKRWQELGYTDNPPLEEKAEWLASIAHETVIKHDGDCRDDHDVELMALPGTRRYENLRKFVDFRAVHDE